MMRQKVLLVLVAAAVAGMFWIGQAISQQGDDATERGGRRQRDPEEMRKRMEEGRKRAAERMRESLGATEEEWKVLQPRIEKVQTLLWQSRAGTRGMMWRSERRERAPREQTEVEKAAGALRKILENKESKPADIKAALGPLRQAREKVEQELAKARKDLREVVTVRQEAQLVLMGLLE